MNTENGPVATIDAAAERAQIARRSDLTGSERRALLTDTVDAWLRQLFAGATHGHDPDQFCLVAIGGYGRREMSASSDIDVLMLHDPRAADVEKVCSAIWYPIWDSGIALDHSVRTVAQARVLAQEDYKVVLGLLDARPVAGNVALAESLRAGVLGDWRASAASRLGDLHAMVAARRARSGDLAQLLEPDIKDSYGGLRDAVVLRALAASWVVEVPRTTWNDSVRTLLDVRDALHARGRRDRLSMQDQAEIARVLEPQLGCTNSDELLRQVYLAAREVAYTSDVAWYRAMRATRRKANSGPRVLRRLTNRRGRAEQSSGPERVPLAEGVVLVDGEVSLARGAAPDTDRGLALRAAAAAAQASVLLAPGAVERLASVSHDSTATWDADMQQSFVSLLGAGPALLPVFEAMDQAGVVQQWIPAWAAVRSLPQHNPIHEFTVDRHLLETTVQAAKRAREVERPDLLLVGAFLHDIGKGFPGDHSIVGEPIASEMAAVMGFDENDAATLGLLVREHLLLPDVATRRDLDDPGTIDAVVERVPDRATLELLHALSWADAEATGPAVRSEWRRGLICDLVRRCASKMATGQSEPQEFSAAMEAALSADGETTVQVVSAPEGSSIVVSTSERVGVLSLVAGVLSLHRLQIRGARIHTRGNRAAQEWFIRPLFGDLPDERAIASDIRAALAGDLDVADRLEKRSKTMAGSGLQGASPGAEPLVFIDNSAVHHTVIEVRAHDEPALLYRLTRALLAADVVVVGAKVDTLGSEVVDSFFVTDRAGGSLGADHADAVRTTVQASLQATMREPSVAR